MFIQEPNGDLDKKIPSVQNTEDAALGLIGISIDKTKCSSYRAYGRNTSY